MRRRRTSPEKDNASADSASPAVTSPAPTNGDDGDGKIDKSWDDIVSSTLVVRTRDEALESVVPVRGGGPPAGLLFKKFWRWHLPLIARISVLLVILRAVVLLWQYWRNSAAVEVVVEEEEEESIVWSVAIQIVQETASLLGLSNDKSYIWIILGLFGRFALATVVLMSFRIYQRLSWRTTELKTFPNVKDDARYQDGEILKKAWELASRQGWRDPTKCSDFKEGVGGGSVVMQPRPGYCGIATLNSTLRSFGGKKTGDIDNAPYLKLHSYPRYVTLEEMLQLVQKTIGSTPDSESQWEKGGGGPIGSMQVIGGGSTGFASLEQFKAALRQLSHPTQPAHIMAIYHRSPLFFCAGNRTMPKLASFPMVHWSPVLSYLEEEDLVLVMDVNHMYGPKGYLLPTERFFDSVNTRDIFNGNYHGLVLLRPPPPKGELPLLTSPSELSVAFGKIKEAYYRHQAAGRNASVMDVLESDEDGYEPLKGNEQGEKSIRLISSGDAEPIPGVVSAHPVFFANEIFLDNGRVPSLEAVRSMIDVFTKLRVPARVAVRGFDPSTASKVHKVLVAAGMVQLVKSAQVFFLTLDPPSVKRKSSKDMVPPGYDIEELIYRKSHSKPARVEELGKLIATSYKFPNIIRRDLAPAEFCSQAYQTFEHGGDLRHFACIDRKSGEMASCVALFCDRSGDKGSRPDVAAIYNVCTSPNHRRKGLGIAMTVCAIEEATKMGCKQVILEASKEGKPLYESMGFIRAEEDAGGMYISVSTSTEDFKWRNIFRLFELRQRIKNGGLLWYYPEAVRQWVLKR